MREVEIEIIRATVVGGVAVDPGQVVTVSASDADLLIRLGKAKQVDVETASAEPDAEAAVMPTAKRKRG
jgi:hypothetical protein